jgi:NitT/TauT family transport system substrate-binding protein
MQPGTGGEEIMLKRPLMGLALLAATAGTAAGQDSLKIAVSQRGFWDSSFVEFAQKEGFFREAGLDVEFFYTDGGAATLQTVTSRSVDIGMSNGLLGVIGAYVKGAPIRAISAQMTGAHELFWYVRADSNIRSLADTDSRTAAFSSPGSSSNLILLSLLQRAHSRARPVATGGLPATLTQVMTGQIDIGWSVPPFALKELQEKRIAIIARASEATELQDQTIRVNLVNAETLKSRRDAITRFMQVYDRAIEWSYANPKAIEYFAQAADVPHAIAQQAVDEFYPKAALQIGDIRGLDLTLKDALQYKFIAAPATAGDVAGLFDIVYRPAR